MNDLINLTEFLVKSMAKNPDEVLVTHVLEEGINKINILVSEKDMGAVIGKNGKVANSIRTIIYAYQYHKKLPKLVVNISAK